MLVNVVGKKPLNFTTEDGKTIDGTHIFVTYEETGVEGVVAEKLFVSSTKFDTKYVCVGDSLEIYFNRYGKVDKVTVADDIDIWLILMRGVTHPSERKKYGYNKYSFNNGSFYCYSC